MKFEYCCKCDCKTGKAGAGDDSLYTDHEGPFCEDCFPDTTPPKRPWVGLTDKERDQAFTDAAESIGFCAPSHRITSKFIETKLKEKNT